MVTIDSKMSLMFESTGHSTSTARKKHVKTDKNAPTTTSKDIFGQKLYNFTCFIYIYHIYCIYQFCFRTDWSTTKLPWIAVPELYRAQMGTVIL